MRAKLAAMFYMPVLFLHGRWPPTLASWSFLTLLMAVNKRRSRGSSLASLSVTGPCADLQSTVVALIYPFRCRRTVFGNTPKSIAPGDAPEPSSLSAASVRDLGWAVSWLTSSSGGHVGFFFSCLSAGLLCLESLTTAETFDSSGPPAVRLDELL